MLGCYKGKFLRSQGGERVSSTNNKLTYRATTPVAKETLDNTIFDENNPDSLFNVIPDRIKPVLRRLGPRMARVLYSKEADLREYVQPDERDERVRLAFWDEYNHATQVGKKMSMAAILHGVMSWEAWVNVYEPNDKKMQWVFCAPVSYQVAMRNILQKGTDRLMEIMSLPIKDAKGNVDTKVVVNILKAFQLVDLRVKGAVAQKLHIQQQSVNLNHHVNSPGIHVETGKPLNPLSLSHLGLEELEALEKRIERARRDSKRLAASLSEEERLLALGGLDSETVAPNTKMRPLEFEEQERQLEKEITLEYKLGDE